jgi:PIN domain nuclease of toxin-antitoxin system
VTVLLDTHAWIWAVAEPDRLGARAVATLEAAGTVVLVSAISFWEVAVLARKGRLVIGEPPESWCQRALAAMSARAIPLEPATALAAERLEGLHGDPADRFLVATAHATGAVLVTRDERIRAWGGVETLW